MLAPSWPGLSRPFALLVRLDVSRDSTRQVRALAQGLNHQCSGSAWLAGTGPAMTR
jgi:hypothetical protein